MASSTMQLLKQKNVLGSESEPGETKINVAEMTVKQLDAFVAEHGVEIEGWSKKKLLAKREALAEYLEAKADAGDGDAQADEPETPAAKPNGAATPAVPTSSALAAATPEVLGPDPVVNVEQEIASLDEETAHALVGELHEASEFAEFKLGGVLERIFTEGWHKGHSTFKDYIQTEHGIHYRKARYLMNIYRTLMEKNVPWAAVAKVGWSKMKELLPVLDEHNAEKWAETAVSMSVPNLIDYVKSYTAENKGKGKADPAPDSSDKGKVKTVQLKLHDDQLQTWEDAITKAKEASGTDVNAVALDFILVEYLGQPHKELPVMSQKPYVVKMLQKIKDDYDGDLEKALSYFFDAFDEVFPDITVKLEMPGEDGDDEDDGA